MITIAGHYYLPWFVERGQGPLVAVALHDGHLLREELREISFLSESERLREEDPYTGEWTQIAPTRIVASQSRFELDLNRARDKAVYKTPADAWGLQVWRGRLDSVNVAKSLAVYDTFYQEVRGVLEQLVTRYGRVVVLDLHTYNHRRNGPDEEPADSRENPEINLGTGTMNRRLWASVVDRFIVDMRNCDYMGRHLDVRENVKFRGGHFAQWVHDTFPATVCVLSVEVKKFFMDEWTGVRDQAQFDAVTRALKSTVWGIHEELVKMNLPSAKVPA
jgi:hypothetical protein